MAVIYIALGLSLVALCLVMAWMFIKSNVHYGVRAFVAALSVALALCIWTILGGVMGYPVSGMPHDGDIVIAVSIDKPNDQICFWVAGKPAPRAYVVPYSDDLAKKLAAASKNARDSNGRMVFHLGNGGGTGHQHSDDGNGVKIDVVPILPPKE